MKCVYTHHAKGKLIMIGAHERDVERIIENPKITCYSSQNKDILEYYGVFDTKHSLKIVLVKTDTGCRIITIILQKSSRDPIVSNYIP